MGADQADARGEVAATHGGRLAAPGPCGDRVWSALQTAMAQARGDSFPRDACAGGPRAGRPLAAMLDGDIDLMTRHAQAGTTLPDMKRYTGLKRRLARAVGRVVLHLAQVVTRRQVQFNLAATTACRDLAGDLGRQDDELRQLRRRVRRLEELLGERGVSAEADGEPHGPRDDRRAAA